MAISPEQQQQDEADFQSAYNEDQQQAPEQSEDEAFGLHVDDQAADGTPAGETPTEAQGNDGTGDGEPRDGGELQGASDGAAEGAADTTGAVGEADKGATPTEPSDADKETQRLKSWEGRLKKMQADLDARAAAQSKAEEQAESPAEEHAEVVADAIEDAGVQAAQKGDAKTAAVAGQVAEAVEDGKMSVDQAMKQLSDDFGEDFVRMIETIVTAKASEAGANAANDRVSKLESTTNDVVSHIANSEAQRHFEAIHDAHPDFEEVGKSDGFKSYVDGLPPEEKAKAEQTIKSGSARDVNKLLSDYKAQAQPKEAVVIVAAEPDAKTKAKMDAAEGVRSSGVQLPAKPAKGSQSYEDAWSEFS